MSLSNRIESIKHFLTEEDGPTTVEYAVLLALILAVIFVSVQLLGTSINSSFLESANMISGASGS